MIFEARNLAVSVAGRVLFRNFNLFLKKGDVTGILGPSGFGKTTLLRTLSGLEDPAEGDIFLEGRSIHDWNMPDFRRKAVYINQLPVMLDMSVRENLFRPFSYSTACQNVPGDAEVDNYAEMLMLENCILNQNARKISVGQMQRVAFIRALLLKPEVMFLDEPASSLDNESSAAIELVVRQQSSENGTGFVVVTHNKEQALRLCSRIIDISLPGETG